MIWNEVAIRCPVCKKPGTGREVGGWISDGQDSDLFVRMRGRHHLIQMELHTCDCGYSAYLEFFERRVRNIWRQPLVKVDIDACREALAFKRTPLSFTPHKCYELAFRTSKYLKFYAAARAMFLVRAYWCLRIPPSSNMIYDKSKMYADIYLRSIIHLLTTSEEHCDRPDITYLTAELARRHSDFNLALRYFTRFITKQCSGRYEYLRKPAVKLRNLAIDADSNHYSMEALFYDTVGN